MNSNYNLDNTKFYPIYLFFKFAPKNRLVKMQQQGYIYMKRLQYFVDLEKSTMKKGQGDKYEGRLFHATELKIMDYRNNNLLIESKNIDFSDTTELRKPVFCITALNIFENVIDFRYPEFKSEIFLDERMINNFTKDEEPYVLVITDIKEFVNRIKRHLLDIGVKCRYGLVKYRDTRHIHKENDVFEFNTAFHKEMFFEYQKEFRIVVDKEVEDYYDFSIGSIADISELIPAKSVISGLLVQGNTGKPSLISE